MPPNSRETLTFQEYQAKVKRSQAETSSAREIHGADSPEVNALKKTAPNIKPIYIFKELVTTEKNYNDGLQEMRDRLNNALKGKDLSQNERNLLGDVLSEIDELKKSSDLLLEDLKRSEGDPSQVKALFQSAEFKAFGKQLATYATTFLERDKKIKSLVKKKPEILSRSSSNDDQLKFKTFPDLFIFPVQRGPRYELLLKDFKKALWNAGVLEEDISKTISSVVSTVKQESRRS